MQVLSDAVPRKYCVRIVPFPNGEGENHGALKKPQQRRCLLGRGVGSIDGSTARQGLSISSLIPILPPHFPPPTHTHTVGVKATFDIPPTYPDVPAAVTIEAEKGLSSSQTTELTAFAGGKALENVGMAMVYTLVDLVREWLAERNLAGQDGSMHAEMLKRVYMKEKEQQREKDAAAAVCFSFFVFSACVLGGGRDGWRLV